LAKVSSTDHGSTPLTPATSPNLQPASSREILGSGATAKNASGDFATQSIAKPAKPGLGVVHLAAPKINGQRVKPDATPIDSFLADVHTTAAPEALSSGILSGNAKQPVAPAPALPTGGDVRPAKLLSAVSPQYPALAKNQHVSGDVKLDALIDPTGHVSSAKVVSGPTLLHQAAIDALRQWRYQPAMLDGKAVPIHLTVTIQFHLQ
jgi:TonB family protein